MLVIKSGSDQIMKVKAILLAASLVGMPAFAGTTADALWAPYNNAVSGAGGISTQINAAKTSSGTCDLACATGSAPAFMPPPTVSTGGEGVATVAALFEQYIGRTLTFRIAHFLANETVRVTPTSKNSATVQYNSRAPFSINNLQTAVAVPYSGSGVLKLSPTGFTYSTQRNYTFLCGSGYYAYDSALTSDMMSAGIYAGTLSTSVYDPGCGGPG